MRSRLLSSAFLFVLGTVMAGLYYQVLPQTPRLGVWENAAVATSLITGQGFANPFPETLDTGLTAHVAPLYPALLAGLFGITGINFVGFFLTLIVHGVHASLLPTTSRVLFGHERPGTYAALLAVGLPLYRVMPSSEAMLSATGAMLFCILSCHILRNGASTRGVALIGITAGALLMLNPALLFVIVPSVALTSISNRSTARSRAKLFLGVFLWAFLVCLPWTIRNYRALGALVFIRDNFGLELYVSQNDCAQPTQQASDDVLCTNRLHPWFSITEARSVLASGEARYNQTRLRTALAWIAGHPRQCLRLTAYRVAAFWFPDPRFGVYAYSIWAITLVSALAFVSLWRRARRIAWLMLCVFVLYPLPYYLIITNPRFRYPILWASLLAAGYIADEVWQRYRTRIKQAFLATSGVTV